MSTPPRAVVVYGAGGHARVVADVVACLGYHVIGWVDDVMAAGTVRHGLTVLGPASWLQGREKEVSVALGIGANHIRKETFENCARFGVACPAFVHPRATVAANARLSDGCVVMAGAIINPGAEVEIGAIINTGAIVEHDCRVGAFAHISPHATLTGAARVGAGTHIGASATVLPGIEVGAETTIGAGAVVVRSIPSKVTAFGVPARVIREQS